MTVARCDDCSIDLDIVWVELVMVHTDLDRVEVGGVSDGCQMWRLFSRPGLGGGW